MNHLAVQRAYWSISEIRLQLAILRASQLLRKYNPDQSRVPAGTSDGGQWTDGASATTTRIAMGRRMTKTQCWEQYDKDTFHCTMVGLRSCHEQAGQRFASCLAGTPIPPLNY
jgi:hypothetical protein